MEEVKTYTEDQIIFIMGAFLGTLQKKGAIEIVKDIESIHEIRREVLEEYKDVSKVANII